ncbi:MAG: MMPL family transporter [Marmoricola sp.]
MLSGFLEVGCRFPAAVVTGWLLIAIGLTVFVTPLGTVVQRSTTAFLPPESSTLTGLRAMDTAFGTGKTSSYLFIVMASSHRLDNADQALYGRLVNKLRAEPARFPELQDYAGDPQARSALTSKDGRATYIAVGVSAQVGTPQANDDVVWLRSLIATLHPPAGTTLYVTGDPAMITDLTTAVNAASVKITAVTIVLLLVILWLVYRRWITVLIPLATIGIALVCTRGLLALVGEHGVALSTYTDAFIIAITLGAGTDYCVFLISRFREEFADGKPPAEALGIAVGRIGPAILASAATVILGALSLSFAQLAIFSTTGPAMAICVAVTVVVSLTFTPALMVWLGTRIGPSTPASPGHGWARIGDLVSAHPARVLGIATAGLLFLAAFAPTMHLSFDERSAQPSDSPSNLGLAALAQHFPANQTLPDYLLISSSKSMANSADLAVINQVSAAVSKVPNVTSVLSMTQPAGSPLKPAVIADQLGTVARGLQQADAKLKAGQPGLRRLAGGSQTLGSALSQVSSGTTRAANGTHQLSSGTTQLSTGLGQATTGIKKASVGAADLRAGATRLANALAMTHDQVAEAVTGLEQIVSALNGDVLCGLDPICSRARSGLSQIASGQRNQLVPGLAAAASGARQLASGNGNLAAGLDQLAQGLEQANAASSRLAQAQAQLAAHLEQLASGTTQMSTGAKAISGGVARLAAQTRQLTLGLGQSASYLNAIHDNANTASAGGFYLPTGALKNSDLAHARSIYLSPDGKVARIEVIGSTDPLSSNGQARYTAIRAAAQQALRGTALAGSTVQATGAGGLGADLQHYMTSDAQLVVSVVLLVVLLILIIALRALVAPLYLLISVVLSCAAALGLTTLVFQHIGGTNIDFTVPVMVFVLLVAVGADYNILLMSRMRETGLDLTPEKVGHAVTKTGPVITAAGIIFAATFVALLFAPLTNLSEIGFAVASGLILDTFVVRSMVVPACAALLQQHNWWPSKAARAIPVDS